MAKKKKSEVIIEEKQEIDLHGGKICEQVMQQLGKHPHFCRCIAVKIRDDAYRVNIRTKNGPYEVLADSFWVNCDENGKIERTDPKIVKKY